MQAEVRNIHSMSTQTAEPSIPRDSLALRVMIARHERGLSQRAAALRCGLTFGEWQGIEGGAEAPRGLNQKVAKIAAGLGYDRDWLMWGGPLLAEESPTGPGTSAPVDETGGPMNRRYARENATVTEVIVAA